MKHNIALLLLLLCRCVYGQQPSLPAWMPNKGITFTGLAGAWQTANKQLNNSAFLDKGWQLGGELTVPLFKHLDIALQGSYSGLSSGTATDFVRSQYQLQNGTIQATAPGGLDGGHLYSFTAGPQLRWNIGRLSIAPGISAGYMQLTRKGNSLSDSLSLNGSDRKQQVTFLTTDALQANGLVVVPRLQLGVALTQLLSIQAGISYMAGPTINSNSEVLQPYGEARNNQYTAGQYLEGKAVSRNISTAFTAWNLQTGIAFSLPGNKANALKPIPENGFAPARLTTPSASTPSSRTDSSQSSIKATAPVIVTPNGNITASLHQQNLYIHYIPSSFPQSSYRLVIWRIRDGRRTAVVQQEYGPHWNGIVAGKLLQVDSTGLSLYEAQLTAYYKPGVAGAKAGSNLLQFTASTVPVYENNGQSNMAQFNIQNNCTVDHLFQLDSTRCLGGDTIRVFGHAQILPNAAGVTSGVLTFDPTFIETTTSTSVTPINLQPGSAVNVTTTSPTSFSFDVTGDMCNKQLRVFYDFSYQCPTLNVPAHIPCADTISLPCCICTYCDDPQNMNITEGTKNVTQNSGNIQVQQQFSITPHNITAVTAQLVYIEESDIDPACRNCAANEAVVYHFTGNQQAQWNGGSAITATAGNSTHTFPAKLIRWTSNNQGNLQLQMQLGLPGLASLECCTRKIRCCIRYTFTNRDCKTCERLVCYSILQTAQRGTHQ
ncbi:hypothetical protein SAMN05421788_10872 [Filimonas lacunae]|uniref:Uncharacterized protein n=1 Tax=Filimonas lacunae TaxID=477680 RepID=A0A173ME66_9BACT|nr:hypothetical protein [Filimonas lacunae]BAV05786.1 hypothetical protein FLA_1798 [Filimonas lacunae]SIT28633.1 hypothetical protein SAMN05421788_10872 [Filimonas lacunae]